ncbi:uncharacterized protein CG7065 [Drosophila virilis]|uniref:Uncharacterized protein n=1 Tax=Drosophila virilis TaxID=7244 RepID=A0A0Q9WPT3_DROVI|nr:uncharacterized protein CG7065 [Drosophila virilis]KRF82699.1 uncharacterized protein Dvir_GJ25983 [Drosophila virilis]
MAAPNKEIFDKTEFSELLSKLSLKDLLKLEFRAENDNTLEAMVICEDQQKKMYLCKVCKVFQYGEKNLFCHLGGKKHCCKMESVKQLYLSTDREYTTVTKQCKNVKYIKKSNLAENLKYKEKIEKSCDLKSKSESSIKPKNIQFKADCKQLILKPAINNVIGAKTTSIDAKKTISANDTVNLVSNEKLAPKLITSVDQKTNSVKDDCAKKKMVTINQPVEKKILGCEDSAVKCGSDKLKTSSSFIKNKYEDELKKNIILQSHVTEKTDNEMLDPCKTDSVYALKSAAQSNIVINPLSMSKKTKISCVPISKLICSKMTTENNRNIDTISGFKTSNDILNSYHREDKCEEIDTISQSFKSEKVNIQNSNMYSPILPDSQNSTFESMSNITQVFGLLGIEYVIKIVKNLKDGAPKFLCTLCNITTDELSMHNHILSYNHRLKFCEKHFPTAIRQYKQYISHVPEHHVFKILAPILEKLAVAIEKHHGRETAYLCYEYSFTKNRQNIVSTVLNRRHASEVLGPAFTHVVDSKDVDFLVENAITNKLPFLKSNIVINEVILNTVNDPNNITMTQNEIANHVHFNEVKKTEIVDDETHKRMVDMFLRDTRNSQTLRHKQTSRISKRSRSRSSSIDRKRRRSIPLSISQWNIERKSLSPLRDGDIWQAYRHMVDQSVRELNTTFELYKSDPEEHPLYKDEWQKFWKRRKDELIAAGINHRSYNYQNEWILFFNARLEELYNQDIEYIKIKCRERLCLPMTNDNLSNSKYHVHIYDNLFDSVGPIKNHKSGDKNNIQCNESANINVIHVLRLLTALEDHLGSLGPSITELLAKALQIFKMHPDKANILLLTSENCAILETAKEKFTGLIISKMLDPVQERALKKAINDTEQLLIFAGKIRTELESSNTELSVSNLEFLKNSQSRVNTNILNKKQDRVDTIELASKLATSLISQGKTSINQEQLQQIVQVYSLIEKKKHRDSTSSTRSVSSLVNR